MTMTAMTTITNDENYDNKDNEDNEAPPEGCLERGCASVAAVPQDELAPPFDVGIKVHDLILIFKALL